MWVFAALLGLPALFDIARGIAAGHLAGSFFAIGPLMMAVFLAWCALQRRAGRGALLESPRVALIGYICFGAFVGSFLVRIAIQGSTLAF
jgi:hypothetical protein